MVRVQTIQKPESRNQNTELRIRSGYPQITQMHTDSSDWDRHWATRPRDHLTTRRLVQITQIARTRNQEPETKNAETIIHRFHRLTQIRVGVPDTTREISGNRCNLWIQPPASSTDSADCGQESELGTSGGRTKDGRGDKVGGSQDGSLVLNGKAGAAPACCRAGRLPHSKGYRPQAISGRRAWTPRRRPPGFTC
jgi:hypothetical protein